MLSSAARRISSGRWRLRPRPLVGRRLATFSIVAWVGSRPRFSSSSSVDRPVRPLPARARLRVPRIRRRRSFTRPVTPAIASNSFSVLPSSDGLGLTVIPAASIAAILLSASPLPPETIAPAWPMRRPGGAVRPAMKPTTGFLRPRFASSARNCAASSSALPPISPIMMIDLVSSSARNISSMSMNSVPLTGSPPMPTAVDWPRPSLVVWNTAS